ncbi:MAG: nucleotidyltransferase domain-containing protein [Parcubacteria group bacterium]|nr:nucleotidyltransferase domain-containing protein [Parcubacteria group bacterium]
MRYDSLMEKDAIINDVVAIIRNYLPKKYKIYIFGSWAKGSALETSDLDIGILGDAAIDVGIMDKIIKETEIIPTLRSVDVVDLQAKSDDFRNDVLEYARLIKD